MRDGDALPTDETPANAQAPNGHPDDFEPLDPEIASALARLQAALATVPPPVDRAGTPATPAERTGAGSAAAPVSAAPAEAPAVSRTSEARAPQVVAPAPERRAHDGSGTQVPEAPARDAQVADAPVPDPASKDESRGATASAVPTPETESPTTAPEPRATAPAVPATAPEAPATAAALPAPALPAPTPPAPTPPAPDRPAPDRPAPDRPAPARPAPEGRQDGIRKAPQPMRTPAADARPYDATRTPRPERTAQPGSPAPGTAPQATGPDRSGPIAPDQTAPAARRRRRIWAGAAVAVVAVVAAILVPFLLRDRGDDAGAAVDPAPSATAAPQRTGTTPSPEAAVPPPAGYTLYRDPAGWSVAVPDGWQTERTGSATIITDGIRTVRIASRSNPPANLVDSVEKLEPVAKAAIPGYLLIRLAGGVRYRGWPTVDWEYTGGTPAATHTLIRTVVPDPKQVYTISFTAPEQQFRADRTYFDVVTRTFSPAE